MELRGWPVLRVWRGAAYVRIPPASQRVIEGGCGCDWCRVHPDCVPAWDTLGVMLGGDARTWTLHAPEWGILVPLTRTD